MNNIEHIDQNSALLAHEEVHALLSQQLAGALARVLMYLANEEHNLEALDLKAAIIDSEEASGFAVPTERLSERAVCHILLQGF